MSELALTASRKARLNGNGRRGRQGARGFLTLLDNPNQFLSTVQVGITSIGVLNGIVGEAAFSGGLAHWLHGLWIDRKGGSDHAQLLWWSR
jgi:putative hemolysin